MHFAFLLMACLFFTLHMVDGLGFLRGSREDLSSSEDNDCLNDELQRKLKGGTLSPTASPTAKVISRALFYNRLAC